MTIAGAVLLGLWGQKPGCGGCMEECLGGQQVETVSVDGFGEKPGWKGKAQGDAESRKGLEVLSFCCPSNPCSLEKKIRKFR